VTGSTRVAIPTLVRIKPEALARAGVYLSRFGHSRVAVFLSEGLSGPLAEGLRASLAAASVEAVAWQDVASHAFEDTVAQFVRLPRSATAVVGCGGGKALDVAKYVAFLARLPYFAVPTSLSNDGFCSPQVSLTIQGKRRSLAAGMPFGVVVDTRVCAHAPRVLTLSGIGDLAAKFTAVSDWKLAFHQAGEVVDDFAALLSDGAAYAFLGRPELDQEGLRLLATSLMFNGIAMEVCGSSRPASGSEHLISHALDESSARPRLHGLQVGVAAYLMSLLQQQNSEVIGRLFEQTGFWAAVASDRFSTAEWLQAVRRAPAIKPHYYTVLSTRDTIPEVVDALANDRWLKGCFGP
jgi:glycerol-1-phosphate dehydrogenase [NAD(P)+]